MTTFKGFDVLEITPSRMPGREDSLSSGFQLLDNKTGKRAADIRDPDGAISTPFVWFAEGREEIFALRAFLAARKGRAVPVWVPTYDADLVLGLDANPGGLEIRTLFSGYTRHLFPHASRRSLQIFNRATGSRDYLRVDGSTDNGDGTEDLALESAIVNGAPISSAVVSILLLCRLESDRSSIVHHTPELATATLRFRELTKEIPA